MKEKLKAKIIDVLNEHYKSDDLDEKLTDAVINIFEEEQPTLQAVKYIGHRAEYSDGLYETGLWVKDQTKLIPIHHAQKMLGHKDVYTAGKKEDAALIVSVQQQDEKEAENIFDDAKLALQTMGSVKEVKDFVHNNINGLKLSLPKGANVDDYKTAATTLINLYLVPNRR